MGQKPADINSFIESEQYFPTQLQLYQFFDKYSRFNYGKGRRETWVETIDRVMDYFTKLSKNKLPQEDYDLIRTYMLELKAAPAMRVLAMGGQAAERDNTAQYNCSFSAMDSIDSMVEELHISMAGCGIGYSVERENVDKLPEIKQNSPTRGVRIHLVQDSAEGWAAAFRDGLEHWFAGQHITFDYSNIRADGTPLKIKGGRASGPSHLKKLLDFTKAKIDSRRGQKLRPIDVHDIICQLGTCVVSGAVRRSALICLFDMDDREMMECKNGENLIGNEQRWMSNNSGVWLEEPTQEQVLRQMFSMFDGERGEPGIFSRKNAYDTATELRKSFGKKAYGTNPCYAPGTLVHTKKGHFPIEELVGKNVEIWDGDQWVKIDNFRVTGENQPILLITLHDGSVIKATDYHSFITEDDRVVQAKDLVIGEKLKISNAPMTHGNIDVNGAYIKGFLLGDGTSDNERPILFLYDTKYSCAERLIESANEIESEGKKTNSITQLDFIDDVNNRKRMRGLGERKIDLIKWAKDYKRNLPKEIYAWSLKSKLEFIAGLLDADGTASDTKNGWLYQISSIHKEFLRGIQALLKTIGVYSKLSLMKKAGTKDFGDGYGEYESQDCWRLTISQEASIILSKQVSFSRLISFSNKRTTYKVKPRFNKVVSIEQDGVEEKVYCCTVETNHSFCLTSGVRAMQCGEINLRPYQFCNLTQAIARPDDTFEDLAEKIKVATIIGTIQSMATNFPNLRPIWKKNCEEERLLGVDINGQLDCAILRPSNPNNSKIFAKLKEIAVEINRIYAEKLGINQSTSVTCVKPNGNSSLMYDVSPGLHSRWSPYYVRNVRVNAYTPMYKILKDANVPMDPENGQKAENASSWVVHFPVKSPEGAIFRNDMTALEQCEYWKTVKVSYTSHNPSVTITYDKSEIIDLIQWVWNNKSIIGGMSFLPKSDAKYPQMPYEEITKEQYEELASKFPRIPFERLAELEKEDYTEAAKELACMGGSCLI